jgi:uncharacterized FlaG/YvyC family protein
MVEEGPVKVLDVPVKPSNSRTVTREERGFDRMDIKGVVGKILPFSRLDSSRNTDSIKTADRDANGQAATGDDQKPRRQYTEEEIQEAVKKLEDIPGIKENGLTIRLEVKDDIKVIYVEDRDGKVVRRIPETELHFLLGDKERKSGHLLNKAL